MFCRSGLLIGVVGVAFLVLSTEYGVLSAEPAVAAKGAAPADKKVDGNRLAYLDGPLDPYYPHRDFPKLITPQWVGEDGVECVVTLAIDDMRETAKYEAFLRPILDRLKQIDGRAPVSIMSCRVDPAEEQLQKWLKEGLSIEVHTFDHPCPLLQDGGLAKAKGTYDKCVDLMSQIPGNKPVAFRMPCCDSKNTPSPRFWAEIFNKTTEQGNFLQIDSSVFNIITNKDKELPKEITELPDGSERFRRYVPFANFVNTIEDYPYPYIIGGMCWEFPCVVPSDWSAQHVQKPNNPDTVRDWKLALDACVIKQGTFNLVFHPHGWIKAEQIVELIDHAVEKHGKKVKFLNFRECAERLNTNPLSEQSLRTEKGKEAGIRFLDADNNGFLDILSLEGVASKTWDSRESTWRASRLLSRLRRSPAPADCNTVFRDVLIAPLLDEGAAYMEPLAVFNIAEHKWERNSNVVSGVQTTDPKEYGHLRPSDPYDVDKGRRFIDLDADGTCEWLVANPDVSLVYARGRPNRWSKASFTFLDRLAFVDSKGRDAGLRLIDINSDGKLDLLFSNHERYCLYLFKDMKEGWGTKVFDVVRGKEDGKGPVIPPFVRADGTNNGAWFHSGALWLMNEDTWRLPDNVFKVTFAEMLGARGQESGVRGQGGEEGGGGECCGGEEVQGPESKVQSEAIQNPQSEISNSKASPKPEARGPSPPAVGPSSDDRFNTLEMTRPLSPEESLRALHVRPGMKVELVAAEPLVVDPVAFDWGPDGRLWVVEMRDYPSGITWKKEGDEFGKPGGRVKVLTDVDGDGKYDKAAVFLDDLPFPTGIKVWRKGILVTAAPEILYAEDKDGDDKADVKQVLYRGFGEGNQQHRVNGLRWGLDNWLYVGNGDSGGVIRSLTGGVMARGQESGGRSQEGKDPHPGPLPRGEGVVAGEVNVAGSDLRIRPDTGELEAVSGNTQFGREQDDWGNWFGNNNSDPLWHYTLEDRYLKRNTFATYPSVKKQVSVSPGAAPVFPRSKTLARFNDDNKANRYTSACGPTIYRDELLGEEIYGNFFVCEPVHNLVSREIMTPQGATFTSRRAEDEKQSEFLASEDSWFRPSMCRTGPDGALWVADMYRFVVEHPKWIPPAAQAKLDMRAGDDKGRIYRIYPEGKQPRPIARLDKLDTAGLVAALDSPNGPQRDLAQQMLVWRGDKEAVEALKKLVSGAKRPQTRLQALCTLEGLGGLTDELLVAVMNDLDFSIRRHAVRLAEPRLNNSPAVAAAVERHAIDSDIHEKIQIAYSVGSWESPRRAELLAAFLRSSPPDPYLTAAAFSSLNRDNVGDVLEIVLKDANVANSLRDRLLTVASAMGREDAVRKALTEILRPQPNGEFANWQFTTVAAVHDALVRRKVAIGSSSTKREPLFEVFVNQALRMVQEAAQQPGAKAEARAIAAMSVLARKLTPDEKEHVEVLAGLLAPRHSPELRGSAISALVRSGGSDVPQLLMGGWQSQSPSVRNQILDALAGREDWSLELLSAVESGQISAAQLDARRRQQFVSARSKAVREKAEKVLAGAVDVNRQKVVETYLAAAADAKGDAANGKVVFAKRCANCHKLEGTGSAVGPDLAPLTRKPVDYLLTAVLDPNRAVEDRYVEYVALTTDGRQLTGILLEETGASLTLAAPEGKTLTVPRGELEQIKSSGKSLMPEGIERDVPPAEMNDILAYLKQAAPPPKQLALNQPEVVQPFNDGSIRLFASNCRAYGPTIKMEETWRALGWWNSPEDHCAWSFDVPAGAAGDYRVTLEYSCAEDAAGNTVVLEANGQTLTGKVAGTGGWEKYRGWNIGTLKLAEGRGEIVVRSSGPIKGALFDLGGMRMVPVK